VINADEIACNSCRIRALIRCCEHKEKSIRHAGGEEVNKDRACVGDDADAGGCASEVTKG
jgi:hypothetical protein